MQVIMKSFIGHKSFYIANSDRRLIKTYFSCIQLPLWVKSFQNITNLLFCLHLVTPVSLLLPEHDTAAALFYNLTWLPHTFNLQPFMEQSDTANKTLQKQAYQIIYEVVDAKW